MTVYEYMRWLGKEAARRETVRSREVRVNRAGGKRDLHRALHEGSTDARQPPWRYGEKRGPSPERSPYLGR